MKPWFLGDCDCRINTRYLKNSETGVKKSQFLYRCSNNFITCQKLKCEIGGPRFYKNVHKTCRNCFGDIGHLGVSIDLENPQT